MNIPFSNIFQTIIHPNANSSWNSIIINIRLPRAIIAILAGAALSVSGLQMQTIFRNPLAGPYVLGISAGASLGVAVMVMGLSGVLPGFIINNTGNWAVIFAAWIGAAIIMLIMLLLSYRIKDVMTLLIIGIMFGSALGALVSILQYFSNENLLKSFIIWTMGSLSGVSNNQLAIIAPVIVFGLALSFISIKKLNIILLGEEYAKSSGMNVLHLRILVFLGTSILTGTITAFCGPIGFIGIAVPFLARLLFKTTDHKILLLATIIIGATVMLFSDLISHLPGSNKILPINSITAIIGIPVIIWIIIKNKKSISI